MTAAGSDFADSVLLVHKQAGLTSFDVVARLRRITRQKKIGHAGTLDKAAEGLLVVCTGRATRLIRFLMDGTKTYQAVIRLGFRSDTCDREGQITPGGDFRNITNPVLEQALQPFKGEILQTPPVYSALKIQGRRASDLARDGQSPEMTPRTVTIFRLEVCNFNPAEGLLTLEIDCSKGTYIRSLARDLGEALGCGAMLERLVRTRSGEYDLERAASIEQMEQDCAGSGSMHYVLELDKAVAWMMRMELNQAAAARVANGAPFLREDVVEKGAETAGPVAIFDNNKKLIAIGDIDFDNWTVNYYAVFN